MTAHLPGLVHTFYVYIPLIHDRSPAWLGTDTLRLDTSYTWPLTCLAWYIHFTFINTDLLMFSSYLQGNACYCKDELLKYFELFGFQIFWACQMKVVPKTHRIHWIWYLRFYCLYYIADNHIHNLNCIILYKGCKYVLRKEKMGNRIQVDIKRINLLSNM